MATYSSKALTALMAYEQADEEGVMVLASRQAIHEVADSHEALLDALEECLREHGGVTIKGECEAYARAALNKAKTAA